jgi:hypothetical protein
MLPGLLFVRVTFWLKQILCCPNVGVGILWLRTFVNSIAVVVDDTCVSMR